LIPKLRVNPAWLAVPVGFGIVVNEIRESFAYSRIFLDIFTPSITTLAFQSESDWASKEFRVLSSVDLPFVGIMKVMVDAVELIYRNGHVMTNKAVK
jgi:hypothetical protein